MARKNVARNQIRQGSQALKEIFQKELAQMGDAMIAKVMARARRLTPSTRLNALKQISWDGEQLYQQKVLQALIEIAADAINQARAEVPKARKVKFAEVIHEFAAKNIPTALKDLPPGLRKQVTKQASLLVNTQLSDLEKNIFWQYTSSHDTTDDMETLQGDMQEAAFEYIDGQSIIAGATLNAAKVVNEARSAFFFQDDVLAELDAFEFVNGDPVTPVCQDLAGTIFAKDDPNMFRYTPPLHWNCKSTIEPVLAGDLEGRPIEKLKPSSKELEDSIQFYEKISCSCC